MCEDKRPDPKPRKHPQLWQAYLWWDELMQMRKRHTLRISSIEAGKSNLDAGFERAWMDSIGGEELTLDGLVCQAKKEMITFGKMVGPVWGWMTSIRGVGDHTAAKILAQLDDPALYATVSKLWRFAGWAVIDGEIDRCKKGEKSPYNRRLKSECYLLAEQFIRHQTPYYADLYYSEKARQRRLHPDVVCRDCGCLWDDCESKKKHKRQFNDGHLHNRAMRKTVKRFLSHLWVVWRQSEGLPTPPPYVQTVLGHTNIDAPPGWELRHE